MRLLHLHKQDVEKIRSNLLQKKFAVECAHTSNTTRRLDYRHLGKELGVGQLDRIIQIDRERQVVLVEPGVPMDRLVSVLLASGYIVPVIPEFKGITVGGAISGGALESSSHRYGQFNDICIAYEVLLGNGEIVRADENENSDLFYGLAGAYGSLGIVTLVEIKLIPAKPWVQITIHRTPDMAKAVELIAKLHQESPDFIEGILFSRTECAMIEGRLVSEAKDVETLKLSPWRPWYYQQIKNAAQETYKIPIEDYLFRHDRGAFWIGAYGQNPLLFLRYYMENRWGMHRLSEKLFGPLDFANYSMLKDNGLIFSLFTGSWMTSRRLYRMMHSNAEDWIAKRFHIQDYYIPIARTVEFVESVLEETGIFPLWLCPIKPADAQQIFSAHCGNSLLVDVGVYGLSQNFQANQILENKARELGGRKMLYSYNYYTRADFRAIYDRHAYDRLRKKYHAEGVWIDIESKILHTYY